MYTVEIKLTDVEEKEAVKHKKGQTIFFSRPSTPDVCKKKQVDQFTLVSVCTGYKRIVVLYIL